MRTEIKEGWRQFLLGGASGKRKAKVIRGKTFRAKMQTVSEGIGDFFSGTRRT